MAGHIDKATAEPITPAFDPVGDSKLLLFDSEALYGDILVAYIHRLLYQRRIRRQSSDGGFSKTRVTVLHVPLSK